MNKPSSLPEPKQAADPAAEAKQLGLPRLPRSGEDRAHYITALARTLGALPPDARLDDAAMRKLTDELLERARSDEYFCDAQIGKALLAAAQQWHRANPEIKGVGELKGYDRNGMPARRVPGSLASSRSNSPSTFEQPPDDGPLRSLSIRGAVLDHFTKGSGRAAFEKAKADLAKTPPTPKRRQLPAAGKRRSR